MKSILIVGSGAREHALAWKLRQSPEVGALYLAPGNAGTSGIASNLSIHATDIAVIARFVEEQDISLTVVGPEAPLALGLADALRARGRLVVGPGAAAARIESSKAFAKEIMMAAGVPTARYESFHKPDAALRYLDRAEFPLVVKADGLAAGKGVVICFDRQEAREAVTAMMLEGIHGTAGRRLVVEEALSGPEVSLLALVDGERVVTLPAAQDHKRLGDDDTGPNTGGMGAYAPVPFLSPDECRSLSRLVLEPVVAELAARGTPYHGVLFAGLMLTDSGPKVLEYNCRLGDPETQVILPLLADDLLPWLEAVAAAGLSNAPTLPQMQAVPVRDEHAVGVVLAAPGYPEKPEVGARIEGLEVGSSGVLVFHAGTVMDAEGDVVTAGGRVLTMVGIGSTREDAAGRAYGAPICFEGMQRRGDIAVVDANLQVCSICSALLCLCDGQQPISNAPIRASFDLRQGLTRGCSRSYREHSLRGNGVDGLRPIATTVGCATDVTPRRVGVLASGEGSNLQALLDACVAGEVEAEIALVVSNNPKARALERAERAGVPAVVLPLEDRRDAVMRRQYEEQLLELLQPYRLDLLVLAGWMLIFSEEFLARFDCPLLNVHPALLPANGADPGIPILRGAHCVRDALALHLPYTGVSVHYVTPEVDAGPVIMQEEVVIRPDDDEESLYCRIKAVEHRLLPRAVQTVISSHYSQIPLIGGVHA